MSQRHYSIVCWKLKLNWRLTADIHKFGNKKNLFFSFLNNKNCAFKISHLNLENAMEVRNHSNFFLYLWIIFENDQLLEWRLKFSVGDTNAFF